YDLAGKGYVDPSDAVFNQLRVWIDANGDGVSQAGELHTLAELGIRRLATNYDEVPTGLRQQGGRFGNDVRYRSHERTQGGCAGQGCYIYDVYFGTGETLLGAGIGHGEKRP